ncbi:DEAD/DEAH box helicase [Agrobacterium sp. DKPNP3]
MKFDFRFDQDATFLTIQPEKGGWLSHFRRQVQPDLSKLLREEMDTALALSRLRQLDPNNALHSVDSKMVVIRHPLVARLDVRAAKSLGLPPLLHDVTFRARLVGTVGSPDFRIEWWWERAGRRVVLPLTGAFLGPPSNVMRVPEPIYLAIAEAEKLGKSGALTDHWLALGRFRRLFDGEGENDRTSLEGFLRDVSVVTCGSVGIGFDPEDDTKFFPLPFADNHWSADGATARTSALLHGDELNKFKSAALQRGAQPAFRVANGKFLIVDRSAVPVINTITAHAGKDEEGRRAFIADAGRIVAEAVEMDLRREGRLTTLMSPEARTEKIEEEVARAWVETEEWVSRVVGVGKWQVTAIDGIQGSGTRWLQEGTDTELGERLAAIPDEDLFEVIARLRDALQKGLSTTQHDVGEIPATNDVIEALSRRLADFLRHQESEEAGTSLDAYLPITHDNFWEVDFKASVQRRTGDFDDVTPALVKSALQNHQLKSLKWQVNAWQAGVPGILNADEQGLGKTLQTLSFITWLREEMTEGIIPRKPFLIVAPTSLLLNWEAEIERHLEPGCLGKPVRLYGDYLGAYKKPGGGKDVRDGEARLDISALANAEGGCPVIITTYQTLANYAISLMDLDCSLVVFDEIQFLKNPVTMRAKASKAVRADFRIGLTGTPIENSTKDLWALVDQLFPGALGALAQFRRVFDAPTEASMAALHSALFRGHKGYPALALRRLKTDAAPHLPTKVRILHPREMPNAQMLRYDEVRAKGGGILALLQHMRRVSLHPGLLDGETIEEFNLSSARVSAAMDILRHIKSKNERALVFVENRDVQSWFAEVVRIEFDLERVMIINGDTTIDSRKDITDRFQRHLVDDRGFDVLILGPRAAGTGLTLTAANHVIHLSRWWNPAVEEQCNDRTHRIGQTKPVTIHIPLAVHSGLGRGSFDCLLQSLMKRKRSLADRILWPGEVSEGETKMLYDAVLAAETTSDSNSINVDEVLEGRSDLHFEKLAENSIRVKPARGGASIIVSADAAVPMPLSGKEGDAAVITLSKQSRVPAGVVVPQSKLTTATLWPEYILPD